MLQFYSKANSVSFTSEKKLEKLTIKMKSGETVMLNVRAMLGDPPTGTGAVYVLIGLDGKVSPASFKATDGKHADIGFFDCIEVVNGKAYAYRFYERKRLDQIGDVI